jgi:Na+-transporting NADH:ubiquinone oxidoreductase subunit NqrB
MKLDPRWYQIAALAGLLVYGIGWLGFDLGWVQAAVTLGSVLGVQWGCTKLWRLPAFEAKSAIISGLSLCLLLRTNSLLLVLAAALLAIGSKFVLRFRGKHVFNPTNFGLVALMLLTDGAVWVSPGQWGNVAFFGFLMVCLGGLVVFRAARSDVTIAFLLFYVGLVVGRSLYVGEPLTIPLHRLQSGALLLFAFFMISDPKTTPDSRTGRIVFAGIVALTGWYIGFRMFRTNGVLWALGMWACAVPLIDWLLPGRRYAWTAPRADSPSNLAPVPLT